MELIKIVSKDEPQQAQIEHIEQQRKEYKKIASFWPTKGLKLFSFNYMTMELKEVGISQRSETKSCFIGANKGILKAKDIGKKVVDIDANECIYFEALNPNNAVKRVYAAGNGKKQLCNLNFKR